MTVVPHCASGEVVGALCLGPSKQVGLVGRSDPCEMQALGVEVQQEMVRSENLLAMGQFCLRTGQAQ